MNESESQDNNFISAIFYRLNWQLAAYHSTKKKHSITWHFNTWIKISYWNLINDTYHNISGVGVPSAKRNACKIEQKK